MIAIFQSCLLPKMRLSVFLEGRFTGYKCKYVSKLKYGLPSVWPYPATLSNRSVPGRVSKRTKSLKR